MWSGSEHQVNDWSRYAWADARRTQHNRDYGPPPTWLGFESLELYRMSLRSWASRTGYPPSQRAGKIFESLPVDIQLQFEALMRQFENDDG
eukprot:8969280-Pyramimonas_sp.AAC.1